MSKGACKRRLACVLEPYDANFDLPLPELWLDPADKFFKQPRHIINTSLWNYTTNRFTAAESNLLLCILSVIFDRLLHLARILLLGLRTLFTLTTLWLRPLSSFLTCIEENTASKLALWATYEWCVVFFQFFEVVGFENAHTVPLFKQNFLGMIIVACVRLWINCVVNYVNNLYCSYCLVCKIYGWNFLLHQIFIDRLPAQFRC
jgi:hypothetical protein